MTTDCRELAAQTTRQALKDLQDRMMACTDILFDPPVTHRFVGGVYAREIFLPKGSITAGRIHKTDHVSVISMGAVEVITDYLHTGEVDCAVHLAPATFTSRPEPSAWFTRWRTPSGPLFIHSTAPLS